MGLLDGKVAVVTGGSQGIGAAIAAAFAGEGARVLVCDLKPPSDARATEFVRCDVSQPEDWANVRAGAERLGRVNILVNNAGIWATGATLTMPLDEWDRCIAINQTGVLLGMQAICPLMSSGGSVVNISSLAAFGGAPSTIAYTASKWAVRGMTKAAAIDLAPLGIRVNSIHPGLTDTGQLQELFATGVERVSRENLVLGIPAGRYGTGEDIAAAAVFLASDSSAYCTGAELAVDGGLNAKV